MSAAASLHDALEGESGLPGSEVRRVRKGLEMTQAALADLLWVSKRTVE